MCFRVHSNHTSTKIATKDIVCYKRIEVFFAGGFTVFGRNIKQTKLITPFRYVPIELGKTYFEESFSFSNGWSGMEIERGLHSYSTIEKAKEKGFNCDIIVKCIIPKGTPYFYNPLYREYVSLKLKYGTKWRAVGKSKQSKDKSITF